MAVTLSKYLISQRKLIGLTQSKVGSRSLSLSTISKLETGKLTNPSLETLLKIAQAYEISLGHLFNSVYGTKIGGRVLDQRQIFDMSFNEIIGAIFIRSQVIEQIMRQMIQKRRNDLPKDFDKKTYGGLLNMLKDEYPDVVSWGATPSFPDQSLYSYLENAKNIRDDAAHHDFLINLSMRELLVDYGANSVDRLTWKSAREGLMMMDEAYIRLHDYLDHTDNWDEK